LLDDRALSPTAVRILGALSGGEELNRLDLDKHLALEQPEAPVDTLYTKLARGRTQKNDVTELPATSIRNKLTRLENNGYIEANVRLTRTPAGKLRDMKFYRITDRGRLALDRHIRLTRSTSASLLNGSTRYFEMLLS
jgi:DNA-binding transcriptional ArsR family regulator